MRMNVVHLGSEHVRLVLVFGVIQTFLQRSEPLRKDDIKYFQVVLGDLGSHKAFNLTVFFRSVLFTFDYHTNTTHVQEGTASLDRDALHCQFQLIHDLFTHLHSWENAAV